jgi:hypothetical protein
MGNDRRHSVQVSITGASFIGVHMGLDLDFGCPLRGALSKRMIVAKNSCTS